MVLKAAEDEVEAARLVREAELLTLARHPGVVELIGLDEQAPFPVLRTVRVDGPSLADARPLPLEESLGLLAALATTLADLHEMGLVHGAVEPGHVVVGRDGAPRLCGLGYGGRQGDEPAIRRAFGSGPLSVTPLEPAVDVLGLGVLLGELAPAAPSLPAPLGRLRPHLPQPGPAGQIAALVARATDTNPSDRPSARALAAALHAIVRSCRTSAARPLADSLATRSGRGPAPGSEPTRPRSPAAWLRQRARAPSRRRQPWDGPGRLRDRPAAIAGVAAVGVLAVTLGGRLLAGPAPTGGVPAAGPGASVLPSPPPSVAAMRCSPPPVPLRADVDGDGCDEPLRYSGGVLEAGTARWSVGRPEDQVAVGDWECTGRRTLALLQPATGHLYRFDGWATTGRDLVPVPLAPVPGGRRLRVADSDRDGCDELVVERDHEPPVIVVARL